MVESCPICGTETGELYRHVFNDHLRQSLHGGMYRVCWCGEPMYSDDVAVYWWSEHVRRNGGLERHLLECGLGVQDG